MSRGSKRAALAADRRLEPRRARSRHLLGRAFRELPDRAQPPARGVLRARGQPRTASRAASAPLAPGARAFRTDGDRSVPLERTDRVSGHSLREPAACRRVSGPEFQPTRPEGSFQWRRAIENRGCVETRRPRACAHGGRLRGRTPSGWPQRPIRHRPRTRSSCQPRGWDVKLFDPHIHMTSRPPPLPGDGRRRHPRSSSRHSGSANHELRGVRRLFSSLVGWERFRASQFGIKRYCTSL